MSWENFVSLNPDMKTGNHKFYARGEDPTKPGKILYKIPINGHTFQYGVGLQIAPDLWDKATQRPTKDKTRIKEYEKQDPGIQLKLKNINTRIENICAAVDDFIGTARQGNRKIDFNELKEHINRIAKQSDQTQNERPKRSKIKTTAENRNLNFTRDFTEQFLIDITNGHRFINHGRLKGNIYSSGTVKNYKNFLINWIDFEKITGTRYTWDQIDKTLYEKFVAFLNKGGKSKNYVGRNIKHWKVICQAAYDDKILSKNISSEKWFHTLSESVKNVALTEEELTRLESLDLSAKPGFEKARDLFLLGCYTALRVSDFKRLTQDHLKNGNIVIITKKTRKEVHIPLSPRAKKILSKYNGRTPNLAEQKINDYIKEICKMAGIDEVIEKDETRGGKSETKKYKKYQLITCHTGRRTGATSMIKDGTLARDVMLITGHTKLASFDKYICLEPTEQIDRIKEQPFFKR